MPLRLWYQSMAPLGHLGAYAEALANYRQAMLQALPELKRFLQP